MAILTKKDFEYNPDKPKGRLFLDVRTGIYHTRFQIEGRRYLLSTGVRDARTAQTKAFNRYCSTLIDCNKRLPAEKAVGKIPTAKQCTDVFLEKIVNFSNQHVSESSAKGYVNCFKRMLSYSFDNWETVKLNAITREVIQKFRAARYLAKKKDINKDKDLVLNHSINSEVVSALSIFSADALKLFKREGMNIPAQILELKDLPALPAKKPDFVPIPEDVDKRMGELSQVVLDGLKGVSEEDEKLLPTPQVAVIYELARYCSLTCKEIQNMKWEWISADDSTIKIAGDSDFSTKRNAKDRLIPLSAGRAERWRKALKPKSKNEYVINDERLTKRLDITARDANKWIKQFFSRKKGLHELRKMATSDFLRQTNGDVFKVANIIGDDPRTMLKYYAAVLKQDVKGL